ncbi:MAG TPA: IS200/IS605 family transposase [Pirellulales bacterium]|nr:IS200/IS605 family transposase [Pirellulales bacterium]
MGQRPNLQKPGASPLERIALSSILVHLVFSTKNREPWIRPAMESELFAYGTTVFKNAGCPTLAMDGMADHIHVLLNLARVKSIAEIVEELKTSTSKWIKTKGADFRGFHWQAGYGAFSVSQSKVADVVGYIQAQKEHHRGRSFQDEFRGLLERHKIAFDERYVWD